MRDTESTKELRNSVHEKLSQNAKLLNIDHYSILDADFLSPNARAIYIPVAITERAEGRKSIYDLTVKEKTLMGIWITDKVFKEYVTRLNDEDYAVSFENRIGEAVYAGKGKIKVLEDRIGYGQIIYEPDEAFKAKGKCSCGGTWYAWSFIKTS
jgi:hypothetical protein